MCEGVLSRVARHLNGVSIYRMGTIGPHSETGLVNSNDFISLLAVVVRSCGLPERAVLPLNWVPVNLLAAAIASLAMLAPLGPMRVFHFQSATPTVQQCFPASVPTMPLSKWRQAVAALTEVEIILL